MEIVAIIFFLIAIPLALGLLGIALKFLWIVARAMALLDYILIGVGMWLLTHRLLEWHTVFVIISIIIPMGVWVVLSQVAFGKAQVRPFNIFGAIFSGVVAAILLDSQIRHPIDPLFGANVAEGYDTIWRVFTFVVVILLVSGIRLIGSINDIVKNLESGSDGVSEEGGF